MNLTAAQKAGTQPVAWLYQTRILGFVFQRVTLREPKPYVDEFNEFVYPTPLYLAKPV